MNATATQLTTSSLPRWANAAVIFLTAKGTFFKDPWNQYMLVAATTTVVEGISIIKGQIEAVMHERGFDSFGDAFGFLVHHYLDKCVPAWLKRRLNAQPPDAGGAP